MAFQGIFENVTLGRTEYANINGDLVQRQADRYGVDIAQSKSYLSWEAIRGPVEERPGEAWALPHASHGATIAEFVPGY